MGANRIAFDTGVKLMFDVKLYSYETLPLSNEQRAIFEAYGAPGSGGGRPVPDATGR
jgi:hypothetical protein